MSTEDRVYQIRRHHADGDHYAELGQAAIGELLAEIDRLTAINRLRFSDDQTEEIERLERENAEFRAQLDALNPRRSHDVPGDRNG